MENDVPSFPASAPPPPPEKECHKVSLVISSLFFCDDGGEKGGDIERGELHKQNFHDYLTKQRGAKIFCIKFHAN